MLVTLDPARPIPGAVLPPPRDLLPQRFETLQVTRDTLRTLSERLNRAADAEEESPLKTDPFSSPLLFPVDKLISDQPLVSSSSSDSSSSEQNTPFKFLLSSPDLKIPKRLPLKDTLLITSHDDMSSLLKIRTFRGMGDGSEDPNDYLDDIECAAEAFEYQKNSDSKDGIGLSRRRFFRQYLSKDGDAGYWWQYVLRPEEKKSYQTIKEKFLERYGTTATAVQSRFEVQSEIMALRQNPGESIASYVRTAEKLSKRVPTELDSILALCLIKGMTDKLKKADISYIVNATPDTTFWKVIEIIKAKYRVIGEPDPFNRVTGNQKSTHASGWGAYVAPPTNNVIPVVATAGRMSTIPSYNVYAEQRMGVRPVEEDNRANAVYGDKKLAEALEGGGISPQQLKGLVDWYLQGTEASPKGHTRTAER